MAKVIKARRLLYFINGPTPTDEDVVIAQGFAGEGYDVVYRNADKVSPSECVEQFDEIAGAIPAVYERAKEAKAAALQSEAQFVAQSDAPPAPAPAKKVKGAKATKPAADPAADPAAESARAALSGGNQAPPAITPAPEAPAAPPGGPAAAPGDLTGGWGGTTAPGAPAPEWKPNA